MRMVMLLLLPLTAIASPVRVGVVDFQKLFTDTATARAGRATLQSLLVEKQGEVDLRKTALERARRELTAASRRLDILARARREAELDAEAAALKKLFTDAQEAVNRRERELSDQVVADAKLIAPEVAKQRGLMLVLGAAEALMWTAPSVVQVDLTAEIGRELDRRLPGR